MRWEVERRGLAWLALVCALSGATWGCNAFDESLVPKEGTPGDLRKPPPRPMVPDSPDGEPITATLRDVVLSQPGEDWMDVGLDLDDLDSRGEMPTVECHPPRPTAMPETDGNQGIDNVFGHRFFPTVALALPNMQEDARAAQLAGTGTLIMQMSGWNGLDDDPRVDVWISQAVDGTSADPADVEFDGFELVMKSDGSPAPEPAWDGNDHWWARRDTFVMGDVAQPRVRDDNAYVANRRVVVRLPDRAEILFFVEGGGVKVRLTGGYALATIDEGDRTLSDILVAGRWAIVDLLDTGDNVGICTGSAEFRILLNQLDTIADVRSVPGSGGEGTECDAISVGTVFESGLVGHFEGLVDAPDLENPCTAMPDAGMEDAGTDAATDAATDAGAPSADAGMDAAAAAGDAGMDAGPADGGAPDAAGADGGPTDAATADA